MHLHTLMLTPAQRSALEGAARRDRRPYFRERAVAILKIADGMAAFAVARHGLLRPRKPDTVYRWLAAYEQGGLAGLAMRPRGHRGRYP